jgi:hypothetical protein
MVKWRGYHAQCWDGWSSEAWSGWRIILKLGTAGVMGTFVIYMRNNHDPQFSRLEEHFPIQKN